MTLQIINNSGKVVDFYINNQCIEINETFKMEIVDNKVNVVITYHGTSSFVSDDNKCFIETNISFVLLCNRDAILLLSNCVRQYQNNTQYSYFVLQCNNGSVLNIKYSVKDKNSVEDRINHDMKNGKIKHIISILGWCLFDTMIDGGLLSLILWFVFNAKIAIICLAGIFVIEVMVRSLCRRLDKSGHRFLNWAKEENSPDDINYLIRNIQKFCK